MALKNGPWLHPGKHCNEGDGRCGKTVLQAEWSDSGAGGGDNKALSVHWHPMKTFEFIFLEGNWSRNKATGNFKLKEFFWFILNNIHVCVFLDKTVRTHRVHVAATPYEASPSLKPPTHRRHEQSHPETKTHDPVRAVLLKLTDRKWHGQRPGRPSVWRPPLCSGAALTEKQTCWHGSFHGSSWEAPAQTH